MNSTRGDDRIREYDDVESTVFANCLSHGMVPLVEAYQGELIPSRAFAEGGIHEAIMAYEDTTFFEILAQELACGTWMIPHHGGELRRGHEPHERLFGGVRGPRHRTTSPWTWNNALHKKSAGRALPADFMHRRRSADEIAGDGSSVPGYFGFCYASALQHFS